MYQTLAKSPVISHPPTAAPYHLKAKTPVATAGQKNHGFNRSDNTPIRRPAEMRSVAPENARELIPKQSDGTSHSRPLYVATAVQENNEKVSKQNDNTPRREPVDVKTVGQEIAKEQSPAEKWDEECGKTTDEATCVKDSRKSVGMKHLSQETPRGQGREERRIEGCEKTTEGCGKTTDKTTSMDDCHMNQNISMDSNASDSHEINEEEEEKDPKAASRKALQREKIRKLSDGYGFAPAQSPLFSPIPETVRKAFKPPGLSSPAPGTPLTSRPQHRRLPGGRALKQAAPAPARNTAQSRLPLGANGKQGIVDENVKLDAGNGESTQNAHPLPLRANLKTGKALVDENFILGVGNAEKSEGARRQTRGANLKTGKKMC